jgi:hypothetical protein
MELTCPRRKELQVRCEQRHARVGDWSHRAAEINVARHRNSDGSQRSDQQQCTTPTLAVHAQA